MGPDGCTELGGVKRVKDKVGCFGNCGWSDTTSIGERNRMSARCVRRPRECGDRVGEGTW